jgi:hypothetical protein
VSKQLLIYEQVAPLSNERHREWSIKRENSYGFARGLSSVPLTAVEFPKAAADYPIVFVPAGEEVVPSAVLGVRDGQNLFLDADGRIDAGYVPAFLRRYPFVFSTSKDGRTFALCIDEKFEGFNQDGRGERLFDGEGEQTNYLAGVLGFLQEYQAHFAATRRFCKKLQELELLESVGARFRLENGQSGALTGFQVIQRSKLHALSGEKLEELSKTGELELAYAHLQSLQNLGGMLRRVNALPSDDAAEGEAAPAASAN